MYDLKKLYNLIFFDVDGVLNTNNFETHLLYTHLLRLKYLLETKHNKNKNKLIISTSWREEKNSLYEILSYLFIININIKDDIIGCTPIYDENNNNKKISKRAEEIQSWFKKIQNTLSIV